MRASAYIGTFIVLLLLVGPLASLSFVNTVSEAQLIHSQSASYTETTRDVEFELGKSFSATNEINHPDFAERSATAVTDAIDNYTPSGVE